MIHIYQSDEKGNYDDEKDFLREVITLDMVLEEQLHELPHLDDLVEELPTNTYVTLDVFVMKYTHDVEEEDEESLSVLLSTIVEDMEDMIDDESLILLENYETTVQIKSLKEIK